MGEVMSSKTDTEVIIGGKVFTLSGYESEEYLQKVASYFCHASNLLSLSEKAVLSRQPYLLFQFCQFRFQSNHFFCILIRVQLKILNIFFCILQQEEICRAIRYAHIFGKKIYLTVNTLVKEREFSFLYEYLSPLYEAGLDGGVIQGFRPDREVCTAAHNALCYRSCRPEYC